MAASAQPERLTELFNTMIEHAVPPMHGLGIRIVELSARRAVATAPLAGNRNHLGTMYAATLFATAEVLGGALWAPNFDAERCYPTVKSLRIDYLRPATTDIRATAELDEQTVSRLHKDLAARGKAQFDLAAAVIDTRGTAVAHAAGTYQIRTHGH